MAQGYWAYVEMILSGDAVAFWEKARALAASVEGTAWGVMVAGLAGGAAQCIGMLEEAESLLRVSYATDVIGRDDGLGWASLLHLLALENRAEEVEGLWIARRAPFPVAGELNGNGSVGAFVIMAEVSAVMDRPVDWVAWDDLLPAIRPAGAVLFPSNSCGLWDCVAGIVAGRAGRWEAAAEYFEAAIELAHKIPHRPGQAHVRRWYADMVIRRNDPGDRERARNMLAEVIDLYRPMGMPLEVRHAERLLASLGSVRQSAPTYPHGLSEREVEVLRLIAIGKTNAQIAEALVISPHTVGRHVSNIFDKLGITHRADAAAWAVRNGLVE
jgi:DNA-binding CsgD family transcriptional regulator